MNYYVEQSTSELYAYDDEQVSSGVVKDGLVACPPRPSSVHVWTGNGWAIPAPTSADIQAQIDALERSAMQNRGDRELALINMLDLARRKVEAYLEANPDDPTPAADLIQHELETTPYWVKLTELNAEIAALRAQL